MMLRTATPETPGRCRDPEGDRVNAGVSVVEGRDGGAAGARVDVIAVVPWRLLTGYGGAAGTVTAKIGEKPARRARFIDEALTFGGGFDYTRSSRWQIRWPGSYFCAFLLRFRRNRSMARRCSVTGKGTQFGNNVSHANNKSRRRFAPNLQQTSLLSDVLNQMVRLRLSTNAIRSIEHKGGLDAFLLDAHDDVLSPIALRLKRRIAKVQDKRAAA